MADLATLMQYAPTTAAGFMGINQANSEQEALQKRQELAQLIQARQQEAQFAAQKQPFELEKLGLANQTTSAQLPGVRATSSSLETAAKKAAGTLDSDIEAGNAKNKMEAYKNIGSHLGSLSSDLDNYPGVEKHVAFARSLDNLSLPKGLKEAMIQRYSKVPADQLAKRLQDDSDKILRETSAYAQAFDTTSLSTSAQIVTNAATNASHERVNQANIEAGKYNHEKAVKSADAQWQDQVAKAPGARGKYAAANAAAEFFKQNGETGLAAQYAAIAESVRPQAEAEIASVNPKPGAVDVGKLAGVPTNQAPDIRPQQTPVGPSGGAQAPKPTATMADVQKLYPGVPPEKLREAYKKKFNVDLK